MGRAELVVLGSGTAFGTDGRGAACLLLRTAEGRSLLVDVGPTCVQAAERLRVDVGSIDGLVLTHLHGDHTAGWPFLLLRMIYVDRRHTALRVVGPFGTEPMLRRLAELCYGELGSSPGFTLRFHEVDPALGERDVALAGLRMEAIPLEHHPTSVGWRMTLDDGRVVAVSGDTRWCEGLERLADGADLLLLECTSVEPTEAAHISVAELGERRDRLRSERIVLVHLTDEVERAAANLRLDGVMASADGSRISL